MISEVVMPQMGADMTEGTILRWLKESGDEVKRGEVIAEIETDKANVEIEAFESGTFRTALAHEGDVVQVGDVIAVIADPSDDISQYENGAAPAKATQPTEAPAKQPAASTAPAATAAAPATAAAAPATPAAAPATPAAAPDASGKAQSPFAPAPEPAAPADVPQAPSAEPRPATTSTADKQAEAAAPQNGRVRASPLARRIANERGIDLAQIRGSGPGGRVTKKDVEGATARAPQADVAQPTPPATPVRAPGAPITDTVVQPTKMRQAIARRMSLSKREAPHYYITADIDMTEALAFRAQVNAALGEERKVSINDLIVRASTLALQMHPEFNATIDGDQVTQHARQHVCIGIALDEGLIAPAIIDAGQMTLAEVGAAAKDLIDRAKNGKLKADEMSAGTFTISNLGAYGVETLIAIIQPPQTAILGVGAVAPQAVARDGEIVVRQMMKAALSADHRVTDGAQGARFLAEIVRLLEQPVQLVL